MDLRREEPGLDVISWVSSKVAPHSMIFKKNLDTILTQLRVATALRRMHMVRWQPYMDECLQILEIHPDALPSDRKVVWWAKLALIMEQASVQLTNDDAQTVVTFADSKVQYTIKAFANQLLQYRREIPEEYWTGNTSLRWQVECQITNGFLQHLWPIPITL